VPSPKARGRSSERIARGVLEKLGYKILETKKKIILDQSEAFEVDILAISPEGEKYCVEVKAGKAGVSDVRKVYADSKILGFKPMLICKGFSDEAAEAVAKKLGVKMIRLSEYYILLEPEELEIVVRTAIQDVLKEYGFYPLPPWETIGENEWKVIEAIARSESFEEVVKTLNLSAEELGKEIGALRDSGVFPHKGRSFEDLRRHSQQLIQRYSLVHRLEEIENLLRRIEGILLSLKGELASRNLRNKSQS